MDPAPSSWRQRLTALLTDRAERGTLIRGAAGGFGVKVGAAGLAFVSQLVLTNALGKEQYGDYVYALTWMITVALIGALGFPQASVRFTAAYHGSQAWAALRGFQRLSRRVVQGLSVVIALLFAGVTWFLTPDAPSLRGAFVAAAAVLPVLTALQLRSAELQGYKRAVAALVPPELVRPGMLTIGIVAAAWRATRPLTAVDAMLLNLGATGAGLVAAVVLVRRLGPAEARQGMAAQETKLWVTTARDMMLLASFNLILFQADTLMVGALIGTDAAGVYNVASKLASLLVLVLVAVNTILAPIIADLHERNEREELQRLVTLGARLVFVVSVGVALGLWVLDTWLLGLFGDGDAFVVGAPALRVLVGAQLVNALAGPAMQLLNMTGHQNISARILGTSAVANLVLNAALIPWLGFVGAAWATALTMVLWNLWAVAAVWRTLRVRSVAL